jgi:tetratricopeptide (TPR) repeat protein
MAKAVSNHHLRDLLIDAGYGGAHGGFARQVNLRGRDRGIALRYDAASVYWWLRGRRPADPVPQVIAEVLARRIGRLVRVAELGFVAGDRPAGLGLAFAADLDEARTTVTALWRRQVAEEDLDYAAPFVGAATAEAGWRWHFDPRDPNASHHGGRRVTAADIDGLRACQQQFLDLDRRHGGGQFRTFLAQWLHREVEPMLHGTYTDRVGRHLFAAVAELTGQVAFMSYDIGDHGLAQRHFIQALRLAKAADQAGFGAHVLANMSTQAVYLRQPGEAVRLARAAVDGGRGRTHASVMARLHTAEACAHAIAGDTRSCAIALRRAERATEKTSRSEEPAWAGYFTPAHLAGTAIRCLRDLGRTKDALRYADQALDLSDGSVRTRALHTALIASVHATGATAEPEHASQLGHDALDLAERVRSRRVADRITDLAHRLAEHRDNQAVDAFLHRARSHVSSARHR